MDLIQSKLLEIAKKFIKVCEILNLKYFALGGTALGAIRHKGFIPWDDDIDFCMPRADYERFLKEGQKLLPDYLFIQTHITDKNYFCPFAKIRDCNTTAIEDGDKDLIINHGLWIDIFPLDGLPDSDLKRKYYEFLDEKFFRRRMLPYRYKNLSMRGKIQNFVCRLLVPSKRMAYCLSSKIARKYDFCKSKYVWWNWNSRIRKNFLRIWFESWKYVEFEGTMIRVPEKYSEYLKEHYGNWEELPPLNQRKSVHSMIIVNLEKPYTDYYKNGKLMI